MASQVTKYISIILLFLSVESIFGQCRKFNWIDADLVEHYGPMSLYFAPDLRFMNYSELYKSKKVSRVSEFNDKFEVSKCEYNVEGFLTSKSEWSSSGTYDYHRYYYSDAYKTVIDSIKHVVYTYTFDPITKKTILPPITDTIFRIQSCHYNENNLLATLYNTVRIKGDDWSTFNRLNLYCPDSLLCYYNACLNLDSLLSYTGLQMKISYSCLGGNCQIYLQPQWQEDWWFDSEMKFQGVARYGHTIQFVYRGKRIVRCKENVPLYYNAAPKDWSRNISYKYRRDKLVKTIEKSVTSAGIKYKKVTRIKHYSNGLPKRKPDGNTFVYSYR